MENYQFQFSKQAQKDIAELTPKQKTKLQEILAEILSKNPYLGQGKRKKITLDKYYFS